MPKFQHLEDHGETDESCEAKVLDASSRHGRGPSELGYASACCGACCTGNAGGSCQPGCSRSWSSSGTSGGGGESASASGGASRANRGARGARTGGSSARVPSGRGEVAGADDVDNIVFRSGVIVVVKVSATVGGDASRTVGDIVPGVLSLADAVAVRNTVVVDTAVTVGSQLDNRLADAAASGRNVVVVNILGVADGSEGEESGDGLELHVG